MPATFPVISVDNIKVRYREPFITAGINQKSVVSTPHGLYRGFTLVAGSSNFRVGVAQDSANADHVAVYETNYGDNTGLTRHSLLVRKTGGNFQLDLTSLNGVSAVTAYIVLYASYTNGTTTSSELRAYTAAEWAALAAATKNELLLLGTCVIPPSGSPAAVTSFTSTGRSSAWRAVASEMQPWDPILRNGSFEHGRADLSPIQSYRLAITDWPADTSGDGVFRWTQGTTARSGDKSLKYTQNAVSTVPQSAEIQQWHEVPVKVGQRMRFTGYIRQMIAPTAGSIKFRFYWGDNNDEGSGGQVTDVTMSVLSTTDASFRQIDETIAVPSATFMLKKVAIVADVVTAATSGTLCYVDDLQVWVEPVSTEFEIPANLNLFSRQLNTTDLVITPGSLDSSEDQGGLIRFTVGDVASYAVEGPEENAFVVERQMQTLASLPPAFALMGRLYKLGAGILANETDALRPRVEADYAATAGIDFTLMWASGREGESSGSYTEPATRMYVARTGEWVFTVNAKWGTTTWGKDVSGIPANAFRLSETNFKVQNRVSDTAWNDASWTTSPIDISATLTAITGNQTVSGTQAVTGAATFGSTIVATGSVTGSSLHWTTAVQRKVPAMSAGRVGADISTLRTTNGGGIILGTTTNKIVYPLATDSSETLTGWELAIHDVAASAPLTARLYKTSAFDASETALGTLKTSAQVGQEILGESSLTITLSSYESLFVVVTPGGVTGATTFHATSKTTR